MKRCSAQLSLLVLSLVPAIACGGGSTSTSGGSGAPPPTGSEFIYAANSSNGIFSFSIDEASGALVQAAAVSPGGLTVGNYGIAVNPSGGVVYAANDVTSGINGYATNSSGALSLITGSPFLLEPPSTSGAFGGLMVEPKGKFLYAASESEFASIAGFSTDSTSGALTPIPGQPFLVPDGIPPIQIAIDPSGAFLYASSEDDPSVPGGNIWAYSIDSGSGALTVISGSPFVTSVNGQPYGLSVDPSGKFLYVVLSNLGSIAAFKIDTSTGALIPVAGSPFPTASTSATQTSYLTIAPSGSFLYAANFNGSTVSGFTIDSNSGALSAVPGSPFPTNPACEGELIVDPSGKFLYVAVGSGASVGSGPIAFIIFDIDGSTGALTPNASSPFKGSQEAFGLAVAKFQ